MPVPTTGATSRPGQLQPVIGDRLELTGRNGATLTGTVSDTGIAGVVSTPDVTTTFEARTAEEPAGVYEADVQIDGADARVGWAVLPDGSQVGLLRSGDTTDPAPPLDLDDRTFVLDGTVHEAERLNP